VTVDELIVAMANLGFKLPDDKDVRKERGT
jgi:hypothetical protein